MRLSHAAALIALGLIGLFAIWDGTVIGGPTATLWFTDIMSSAAPAVAAVACWIAARKAAGRAKLAWRLLGTATASWSAGQIVWSYYNLVLQTDVPFPSLADAGYLLMIPLAAAAIFAFPAGPGVAVSRARQVLDGLVVAASLFFLSWGTVLGAVYAAATGTIAQITIGLAYPAGDVILLTVLMLAIVRSRPGKRDPLWIVGLGFVAFLVSDSLFAYLTAIGKYSTGIYVDNGWFDGFLIIGVAAIRTLEAPDIDALPEQLGSTTSAIIPLFPVVLSAGLAMVIELTQGELDDVLFWSAMALVGAVLARQLLMLLEQQRLAREIQCAYVRLQEEERKRIQLLNNVAHDLGSPLTPIMLQLQILRAKEAAFSEEVRRSHTIIARNVDQLRLLRSDLADLARMEAGELKISPTLVDLAELARAAYDSHEPSARAAGIELRCEIAEHLPARADAGRLNQALYNLLTNAIKFTPAGGTITIRARRVEGEIRIDVTDSGRGLTPEEQAALFRPFVQVHQAGETKERGTGLGLFITRGIMESHGGRADVESAGRGKGSTFKLALPATDVEAPRAMEPFARVRA